MYKKVLHNIKKMKKYGGGRVGGGQGGCERRIKVFVKIKKNFFFFFFFLGGGGGGGVGRVGGRGRVWGCQGGCERRIEGFVKIQKKNWEGGQGVSGCGVGSGWM